MKTRQLLHLTAAIAVVCLFKGEFVEGQEAAPATPATVEPATEKPATIQPAAKKPATLRPATIDRLPANHNVPAAGEAIERVRLFDSMDRPTTRFSGSPSTSDVRQSRMTSSELRQARALYKAQQRTARLEYNLWMGIEPLRPNWNSVPMMSSRYSNRRIYVPVYVPSR